MGYKMLREVEVLLEKVMISLVRMNPQLRGTPLPETVHGRRRMLAILAYIWGVGENPKKTMLLNAQGLNNADLTPIGVALEKALVTERRRRAKQASVERRLGFRSTNAVRLLYSFD